MKIKPCCFCKKNTYTPITITDVLPDGTSEVRYCCKDCLKIKSEELEKGNPFSATVKKIDLSKIVTPEQLFEILSGKKFEKKPCVCGLTTEEFDRDGKFGCPNCYSHFSEKIQELVLPFHKAKQHFGKRPSRMLMEKSISDPIEREKILKLRYAKALELEDYESCGKIVKELAEIKKLLP
jgi:protein arginine kinase activator